MLELDRLTAPSLVAVAEARLGCLVDRGTAVDAEAVFRIGVGTGGRVLVEEPRPEAEEEEEEIVRAALTGVGERDGSGCCWEADEREETVRVGGRGVAEEGKDGGG